MLFIFGLFHLITKILIEIGREILTTVTKSLVTNAAFVYI